MQNSAFRQFEHDFWNKTSTPYDSGLGAVTAESVPFLLQNLKLEAGQSLLDVACGPGYITRMSATQGVQVTGVDFSEAMINFAKEYLPEYAFQVADAEDLPFSENSFDAVCCNFGMMHFANPEKAMTEAIRVCKPGGQYTFTVWENFEKSPAMALIFESLKAHVENTPQTPEGLPFFFYAESSNTEKALKKAGIQQITRQTYTLTWPIESAESYIRHLHDGGARIGGILRAQTPATLEKITSHIQDSLEKSDWAQIKGLPVTVVLYTAIKS